MHCVRIVCDTALCYFHCRVSPLYQHIFPPSAAPTLSFVGLPWKVVPFAQYELQAKWIARVLSGRVSLPTQRHMLADISAFYAALEKQGVPKRSAYLSLILLKSIHLVRAILGV